MNVRACFRGLTGRTNLPRTWRRHSCLRFMAFADKSCMSADESVCSPCAQTGVSAPRCGQVRYWSPGLAADHNISPRGRSGRCRWRRVNIGAHAAGSTADRDALPGAAETDGFPDWRMNTRRRFCRGALVGGLFGVRVAQDVMSHDGLLRCLGHHFPLWQRRCCTWRVDSPVEEPAVARFAAGTALHVSRKEKEDHRQRECQPASILQGDDPDPAAPFRLQELTPRRGVGGNHLP